MRGYIKLSRSVLNHPALNKRDRTYCEVGAWLWLLLEASFAKRDFTIGTQTISLDRGELCHSVSYIAEAWGWNTSRTRHYLDKLVKFNSISFSRSHGKSADFPNIIKILNYDDYQDGSGKPDGKPHGNNHKEIRSNDIIYSDEFNELWVQLRAKKGSKKKARDKYLKIRHKVKRGDLIEKYNKLCDETKDFTFIPHFITWLNGERYLDNDKIDAKPRPKTPDQYFREKFNNVPKGYFMVGSSWNEIEYSNGKNKITFKIKDGEKI